MGMSMRISRKIRKTKKRKTRSLRKTKKLFGGADIFKKFNITLNLFFRPTIRQGLSQAQKNGISNTTVLLRERYPTVTTPVINYIKQSYTAQELIDYLGPLGIMHGIPSNEIWVENTNAINFDISVPSINSLTDLPVTAQDIREILQRDSLEDAVYEGYDTNGWVIYTLQNVGGNLVDTNFNSPEHYQYGLLDYRTRPIIVTSIQE